jgi:glycosyltransferase involved in cell wall biosynthesis
MYKQYNYNDKDILYSVIVPVYNQETIIVKNIKSILEYTVCNFELIIILDFCFDNTEKHLLDFLDTYTNDTNLCQITIFKNMEKPLFETKCDNIGFKHAKGKFCLEIQADMEMTEMGYNLHLTKPFELMDNVIAVSGRCAHNLFSSGGIGKLGHDIEKSISELKLDKDAFYVFETCNRGPLLLDRSKLIEMDYLNEEDYFLDNSDHDLMARAFLEKNYICGYVPIDFNAPICDGSTRNTKYVNCKEYFINREEKNRLTKLCNDKPGIYKYRGVWKNKIPVKISLN